jgi:hypothetical protein
VTMAVRHSEGEAQVGLGLTRDNGGEECIGGSQFTSLVFIYNQHSVFNIGGEFKCISNLSEP